MNAQAPIEAAGPAVYAAIAAIQGELAKVGIAKARRNTQGSGYNFRGIDDVYSALSPLLAKHGLCVLPRVTSREVVERQSKQGGALFYTTVHAEFDFVAVIDGSKHTCATYGEAMDSGDKSTNKAMSAAYKYAAFMAFAIPVEGEPDADSETHEVAPGEALGKPAPRTKLEGEHSSASALKKAVHEIGSRVRNADTEEAIDAVMREGKATVAQALKDYPALINGDPQIPECIGLRAEVERHRTVVRLLEAMRTNTDARQLAMWVGVQEPFLDDLPDADRRRFETELNNYEAGLQQAALVKAG